MATFGGFCRAENAGGGIFQQPVLEEGHAGIRHRRIILIRDPAIVPQHLPVSAWINRSIE